MCMSRDAWILEIRFSQSASRYESPGHGGRKGGRWEEEGEEGASLASSTSSLERARGHLERAEKKTRPTVRRWKPKMKVAGDEFCKAAVLFYKVGKLMELNLAY